MNRCRVVGRCVMLSAMGLCRGRPQCHWARAITFSIESAHRESGGLRELWKSTTAWCRVGTSSIQRCRLRNLVSNCAAWPPCLFELVRSLRNRLALLSACGSHLSQLLLRLRFARAFLKDFPSCCFHNERNGCRPNFSRLPLRCSAPAG